MKAREFFTLAAEKMDQESGYYGYCDGCCEAIRRTRDDLGLGWNNASSLFSELFCRRTSTGYWFGPRGRENAQSRLGNDAQKYRDQRVTALLLAANYYGNRNV
jgi:hypothetical protein